MPRVYVKTSNVNRRRFHRVEDCGQLRKAPAMGRSREVVEIDLEDCPDAVPCLYCYPDAPRARSVHKYCYTCDPGFVRPCAHNGGVKVFMTRTRRKQTLFQEPGEVFMNERYVWPERVLRYSAS